MYASFVRLGAVILASTIAGCNSQTSPSDSPEPVASTDTGVDSEEAAADKTPAIPVGTESLIASLKPSQPVRIEAFVTPKVPKANMDGQRELLAVLDKIKAANNPNIEVRIFIGDEFSVAALRAKERFGIRPRQVSTEAKSSIVGRPGPTVGILRSVVVRSGYDEVIHSSLLRNEMIEYEIVRSICAMADSERKRLGLVETGMAPYDVSRWKQEYDLVKIDPTSAITKSCTLLAIQPSRLGPDELKHLVDAVRSGWPAVIFEDPHTVGSMLGTRPARRTSLGMHKKPVKTDLQPLWDVLGIEYDTTKIVWQDVPEYLPISKQRQVSLANMPKEFVFVGLSEDGEELSKKSPITAQLERLALMFPGAISQKETSTIDFVPLIRTSTASGTNDYDKMFVRGPRGARLKPDREYNPTNESYVIAAHISGNPEPESPGVNAIVIADVDIFGDETDHWKFVSNALDVMVGENRFLTLRNQPYEAPASDEKSPVSELKISRPEFPPPGNQPDPILKCPQFLAELARLEEKHNTQLAKRPKPKTLDDHTHASLIHRRTNTEYSIEKTALERYWRHRLQYEDCKEMPDGSMQVPGLPEVEIPDGPGKPLFENFPSQNKIAAIAIKPSNGKPWQVVNVGGHWVTEPSRTTLADGDAIAALLEDLSQLKVLATAAEDPDDVRPFYALVGGAKANGVAGKVTLLDAHERPLVAVAIGRDVPGHPNLRYVRRLDRDAVYIATAPSAKIPREESD